MSKKRGYEEISVQEIQSSEISNFSVSVETAEPTPTEKPQPVFKNPNFKHLNLVGNKKKPWKTLKQILAAEQSLTWPEDAITYSSLEAPPSFRPAKKYSDISGIEANYTDPQTKLHYACPEEFAEIRKLPSDIVQGYLALRKANTQLQ
jgi:hypothetical protein